MRHTLTQSLSGTVFSVLFRIGRSKLNLFINALLLITLTGCSVEGELSSDLNARHMVLFPNNDQIPIFSAPDINGPILTYADEGQPLKYYALLTKPVIRWLKVGLPNGKAGWTPSYYTNFNPHLIQNDSIQLMYRNGARLRQGPGLQYQTIQTLYTPTKLVPLGQKVYWTKKGHWLYVKLPDGTKGWIQQYLTTFMERIGWQIDLESDETVVRKEPSSQASVLRTMPKETPAAVLDLRTTNEAYPNDKWLLIELPDESKGWVRSHDTTYELRDGRESVQPQPPLPESEEVPTPPPGNEIKPEPLPPKPEPKEPEFKPAPKPSEPVSPKFSGATLDQFYTKNYGRVRTVARQFWPNSYGCAAYASTALRLAGLPIVQVLVTNDLERQLKKLGWKVITDMGRLMPGDVVFTTKATSNVAGTYSHVFIFHKYLGSGMALVNDNYGKTVKRNIGRGKYSPSVIAYRHP